MEFALPTVLAALALIFLYWRSRRHERHAMATRPREEEEPARSVTVVLDVSDAEPEAPSVQRLVHEAGSQALSRSPEVGEVRVVSRAGKLLGHVTASIPMPHSMSFPALPIVEPRAVHRTAGPPGGLEDEIHPTVIPRFDARERPAPRRPLIESFDLPESVRARIRDGEDPVDIVRAILEAAGVRADIADDVLRAGDTALVVLPARHGTLMHDSLNHAYLRFHESGAARGIVVSLDLMDPTEVRRRELLAPELRHAGREAIQRMADAVALGGDPLAFALAPAVVSATAKQGGRRGDVHRRDRQAG